MWSAKKRKKRESGVRKESYKKNVKRKGSEREKGETRCTCWRNQENSGGESKGKVESRGKDTKNVSGGKRGGRTETRLCGG